MLTTRVRTQIVAFIAIALLAISYISLRYVGVLRVIGATSYTVHVDLARTGGLFTNGEVTYRGVTVGRVGAMRLTKSGIEVDLTINSSAPHIPANTRAIVTDRSVIGEQYLDLQPANAAGPYLHDGSLIHRDHTALPLPTSELLSSVNGLVSSVPVGSLRTVVDELGAAFQGSAGNLQTLLDSAQAFFTTANANFPQTAALIDNSATVLATQRAESGSIISFSSNLSKIAAQLRSSDGDLRKLINTAPAAANQLSGLINDVGTPLGVVLANLMTTSQVFLANVNGVREVLARLPDAINVGSTVFTPKGVNVGLAVTFFTPLPCTAGYRGTQRRSGKDVSQGQPLNTSAGCTASSSSGIDVRGVQHAPDSTAFAASWVSNFTSPASSTSGRRASSLAQLLGSQP